MSGFLPGSASMIADVVKPAGTPGDNGTVSALTANICGKPTALPPSARLAPAASRKPRRVRMICPPKLASLPRAATLGLS